MGDIHVAVDVRPFGGVEIYIGRGRGSGFEVAQPVELIFKSAKPEEVSEPTLRLGEYYAHELLQALAEGFDSIGIRTDKDAKIEGTLGATRYHLEDLRSLLKLGGDENQSQ